MKNVVIWIHSAVDFCIIEIPDCHNVARAHSDFPICVKGENWVKLCSNVSHCVGLESYWASMARCTDPCFGAVGKLLLDRGEERRAFLP